jgi:Holliday junction resolvasome RuvABC ATP-dependent DNA helicase subunit
MTPDRIRTPGVAAESLDRVQTPGLRADDELDVSLRPRRLDEFVGQDALKAQLGVAIRAAAARGDALDHVLLAGPPGLGKTSLAQIVAAELEVDFVQTAGPALERKADIAAFLTALEPRSVFFVDEIHRLPRAVEETFYPAMEDRQLPITVGAGAGARVVTLELPPFTLIGATTRAGLLTTPLRDRFGLQHRLEHYGAGDLSRIVVRSARVLGIEIEAAGAGAIAARSRGTPRVANRLLRRPHKRRDGRGRPRPARGRPRGPGPAGPRDPGRHLRPLRRRPRRALHAGRDRGGGARHDRGRLRALPAPARIDQADPARAVRHGPRVPPPRARAARRGLEPLLAKADR